MENQENHVVHKSNDLVEAKFKLPLIEQRILAICVSKINPTKMVLENPYRFSIKEYCLLSNNKIDNVHKEVKRALKSLQSRTLEKYDPDLGRTRYFNWTRKIDAWDSYSYDIYFHEEIESDLLAKTKYTKYLLKQAFNLNSKYSLRLYEVSKQRKGQARSPIFGLDKLRLLLGVEESIYPEYRDFKKRCFQKAVDEINKKTDLNIEYNEFRKNRKVDLIELIITESKPAPPKVTDLKKKESIKISDDPDLFELMADKSEEDTLIEKLQRIKIQPRVTLSLIDEFGLDEVLAVYEEIVVKPFKEDTNIAGVLINRLRDNLESKTVTTKKEIASKSMASLIEKNRIWWNENYHELLAKPFWLQDRPLFMKTPPTRVESDSYCMLKSEPVMFNRPDFQDYIIQKSREWSEKVRK